MKIVKKKERKSNAKVRVEAAMKIIKNGISLDSRLALIQQLIPLGLMAVEEVLQAEVTELAGKRYQRDENPNKRWGRNAGSVYLGDQKQTISVPRVRNQSRCEEVPLRNYRALQSSEGINDQALAQVINGISTRKFEKAARQIPSTFGIQKSSISRKFIEATAKKLKTFRERDLSKHEILVIFHEIRVIFIDGKRFAENERIIAWV